MYLLADNLYIIIIALISGSTEPLKIAKIEGYKK